MSRTMPTECEHGVVIDWGHFGPCQDCAEHPGEDCPNFGTCDECAVFIAYDRAVLVDVLIIGPLYKLLNDDPVKEMPAKAVADAIDWLRARRDCAILIEAHSPYADGGGKNRPVRPYGASLWSRWPEFGIHLDAEGKITHWRGQRDERAWPTHLERAKPWPWAPRYDATSTPEPWDGPKQCQEVVVAFINEVGGDFTITQLGKRLRERNLSYRDATISVAVKQAAAAGRIDTRSGPRGALICSPAIANLGDLIGDPQEEF